MVLDEDLPYRDLDAIGYWVEQPLHIKFLHNEQFRSHLQNYLENLLSIKIAINQQQPPKLVKEWYRKNDPQLRPGFMIEVIGTDGNAADMGQAVSDFCQNYLAKIQTKDYKNTQVQTWLSYSPTRKSYFQCIRDTLDTRTDKLFKNYQLIGSSLQIHFLTKEPYSAFNGEEIDQVIKNEILHEIICLSLVRERLQESRAEIRRIRTEFANEKSVVIGFDVIMMSPVKIKYKFTLFGYFQSINQVKERILKIDEKHDVIEPKLCSMDILQIEALLEHCPFGIRNIKNEYKDITSDLCLRLSSLIGSQEFGSADESRIAQLVSKLESSTFNNLQLPKAISKRTEKNLHNIAHRYCCCIKTELNYTTQHYSVPKEASSAISYASNSIKEQSIQFCSSSDVVTKVALANGSIEIRTGDISQQQVDAIVISTSPDGLQEGLIEGAGAFNYEQTYTNAIGTRLTKTDGGNLSCKRILFCDWISPTDVNNEFELRKSIRMCVANCIEYALIDEILTSIAFATPDLCTNEKILAEELISEAKRQLETRNLRMTISFVFLAEQLTLFNEFFLVVSSMQNAYTQFEWTTAILKIMLVAVESNDINRCQEKINSHLNHCIETSKIIDSDGIFNKWDQYTINAFYKFSKDKHVLPRINKTGKKLELSGPVSNIHDAKHKWYLLRELVREKTQLSTKSSVALKKTSSIMISYSERDVQPCQRLINRLIEEEFMVWAEPVKDEQLRDVSSQIDKADCIILCISESSYESRSCEKEARYTIESGKSMLLVKVHNDPLIGWQREIFEGKLFIQLFGSENHFDLEFMHLLLQLYRLGKSGHDLQREYEENEVLRSLLTIEQRRAMHNEKIKTLMNIGHINGQDMKDLITQSQNVLKDVEDDQANQNKENEGTRNQRFRFRADEESSFEYIRGWLERSTNNTKQNLPPFSVSGDINDAPFPMPQYIMKCLNIGDELVSSTQSAPLKLRYSFESDIIVRPSQQSFSRTLFSPIPADKELVYGEITQRTQLLESSQNTVNNDQHTGYVAPKKTMRLPLIPSEVLSTNEKALQKCPNFHIKQKTIPQQDIDHMTEIKKRPMLDAATIDVYRKKFAEQMSKNIAEFEAFCLAAESKQLAKTRRR